MFGNRRTNFDLATMAIDYEKICNEWLEYISTLELEERKSKFKEYLEAAGVYDLDSSTQFYKSELNNFLTEGITTLLHDKAQEAKKSGKGLAHYRHTSFALSKPDAMNIVHEYIHKKILAHNDMKDVDDIPNTFGWDFLFNVPEYVFNKPLLTNTEIPQLPQPRTITNEQTLKYSPDQYTEENAAEYSPDPFDIDDNAKQQQLIESIKDKIVSTPLKEDENENQDQEYSPDPYDIDENEAHYSPDPIDAMESNTDKPIHYKGLSVTGMSV